MFVVIEVADWPAAPAHALVTVHFCQARSFAQHLLATGLIVRLVVLCRGKSLITAKVTVSDRQT